MVRVLQIASTPMSFQTQRGIEQLRRGLGPEFACDVRTIGRGGGYRHAAAAVVQLRRSAGEFDVIHAWGTAGLLAAAMASDRPILYSPEESPRPSTLRWLRAVLAHRDVQVVAPTATLRRRFVEHGVPLERCHLIRPGVDFARVKRRRDPALRGVLGFEPEDRVFLLSGESTRAANHEEAVWALSILNVLDRRFKALMWGRGPRAASLSD